MNPNTLYYQDSHMKSFVSHVVSCEPDGNRWAVQLENTAFYPEGGGQAADHGTLEGVNVIDVQEKDDKIVHYCDNPLTPGMEVHGEIDWIRRFDLMQQHSGEHILSGIIHSRYGYHNVGFHMGADTVTIDFDGMIPAEDLPGLEKCTNEAIWKNLPLKIWFASPKELETLPYRSKRKLEGTVRLVEVPGYDLCACCGTHVYATGEVGMVKILSWVKFHQGIRMEIVCGSRALRYFEAMAAQNRQVSQVFSAKPLETGAAAQRIQEELDNIKFRCAGLENKLFDQEATAYKDAGDIFLVQEDLSPDALRRLTDKVGNVCGGRCIIVSGSDEDGYKYAICHQGGDLRSFTKDWNQALSGRGGGKPNFVQGSVRASLDQIRQFLAQCV